MADSNSENRELQLPNTQRVLEFLNKDLATKIKAGLGATVSLPSHRQLARDIRDEARPYVHYSTEEV